MKFKSKTKDYFLNVKTKTDFGEKIDEKELDRFARLGLRGFMKPKTIKKSSAEFIGPIGESLYERLKYPISKREFLFIMEHLVVAVQKIQANNLPLANLVLNIQNTYINKVTKEVQFLYVPIINAKPGVTAFEYIDMIVYSAQPEDDATAECISKFVYFIKSLKYYEADKVEKFIEREDRSVVNTIKKHNAGQSGYMTDKPMHYYEHYDQKEENVAEFEEATGLLEEEATGLLEEEATGLLEEPQLWSQNDENETALLVEEPVISVPEVIVHYPSLTRLSTDETVSVNKPVFRIGKENSYVDYFVCNNINVSRSHADIITRGEKYFVTDLNSKNHSYINGQILMPQCETEIHDGDTLRLANEDFIFHV